MIHTRDHHSSKQIEALDGYFKTDHYPKMELKIEIGEMIGLTPHQVTAFCNLFYVK